MPQITQFSTKTPTGTKKCVIKAYIGGNSVKTLKKKGFCITFSNLQILTI